MDRQLPNRIPHPARDRIAVGAGGVETGAGDALAKTIWAMHPGQWLVRVYEGNVPAIPFWRKIISRYANDRQIEERRIVNGKAWSFFQFKSDAA